MTTCDPLPTHLERIGCQLTAAAEDLYSPGPRGFHRRVRSRLALIARGASGHAATVVGPSSQRNTGRLKRRALALSLPATAAAAAVATVLVTAGGAAGPSSASAAIIRHVRAELTAPLGLILHESATVTLPDGSSTPFELWAQTGDTGVYRVIKWGNEVSLSDTKNEIYDPSTNTVTISPLPLAIHQREVSRGGDLADELKRMVDSGRATATPTTYDGIPAYELSLHAAGGTLLNGNAYVARSDYRPLEIDSTTPGGDSEKVVFSTYEYLPATPANDALLAVTTAHPGATVVNQP
jgi:outer membrane lipoprotein-sorting protein